MKKLLVFASGSATGGGSGFQNLVEASRDGRLNAEIIGVVSNRANGKVRERAEELGIPFIHFPGPWDAESYQRIARESGADFFALSGWLKLVVGLDPETNFNSRTVFNIHPGLLPEWGGNGMYGHHVHEAVMKAYEKGQVQHSGLSMHFVTEQYDDGPVFFRYWIEIDKDDTAETLGKRVNHEEHRWQPVITNLVVNGDITWDGVSKDSLKVPELYQIDQ